jgi:hypothetical protein
VTAFGLVFTPVFYVITRWLAGVASRRRTPRPQSAPQPAE